MNIHRAHQQESHRASTEATRDDSGPAATTPGTDDIGDGSTIDKLETVWNAVFPESMPPPTTELGTKEGFWSFLVGFVITLGIASVLIGVVFFLKETMAVSVVVRTSVDTRLALFEHLTHQSVSYFHNRRSGDLTSRVTNDVEIVQGALRHLFHSLLQQPVLILASLGVAFWASATLFLFAIPVLVVMVIPIFRSGRRVLKHGRRRQRNLGVLTEALQQLFSGIRIVKAFGAETHEREEFRTKNLAFGKAFRKTIQAKNTGRSIQEILYSLGLTGLLLLGAFMITRGELSLGDFSVFILAMVQVYAPLKTASKALNQLQEAHPGVERVLEILRTEPTQRDVPNARDFPGLRDEIVFDDVHFAYRPSDASESRTGRAERSSDAANEDEEEPTTERPIVALEGIDLRVNRGELVALVGPSGAGKSTLVDLLARFYDVTQGAIRIDGVDIREFTMASYLESIAIVSQDPFLFNTTIRENIGYGRHGATQDEIVAAARAANAHDFIVEQPNGYDTEIGDRGAKLSGGQRQRLTIARALLKNAPILILDEATSALDTKAEREVQKAIDELVRDRTTFVVAHRLSTVVQAHRIIVLEDGRIVESGRHDELLALGGRYHDLYTTQNVGDRPGRS